MKSFFFSTIFAICINQVNAEEPAIHPSALNSAELAAMSSQDLKALFYFLVLDDLSNLEGAEEKHESPLPVRSPRELKRRAHIKRFTEHQVYTTIGGHRLFQKRSYNVSYHFARRFALNIRRSHDISSAIKVLRALEAHTDPDAQNILYEIVSLPPEELFKHKYDFAGPQPSIEIWKALDFTARRIRMSIQLSPGGRLGPAEIRHTMQTSKLDLIEEPKLELEVLFRKLQDLIHEALALKIGRAKFQFPVFNPKTFKKAVLNHQTKSRSRRLSADVFVARMAQWALRAPGLISIIHKDALVDQVSTTLDDILKVYLKVGPALSDPYQILRRQRLDQLSILYDKVREASPPLSDPQFQKSVPDTVVFEMMARAQQKPEVLHEICKANMRRLGFRSRSHGGKQPG